MSTMQVGKRSGSIKRLSFEELGLDKERYLQLKAGCQSGLYSRKALRQACRNMPEGVETFILKSVTEDKTFEMVEYCELGRICVGRSNFYALRRQFYGNLNRALKERDAEHEAI